MEIYLVGGAVRDKILGIEPKDLDYVVIGESEQSMIDAGYKQVGKDFPVFLHPETNDEYALARTERTTGAGYNNFSCETNGVTLIQDLSRRDLTMNSIAMNIDTDEIIDPFNGVNDITDNVLRHTSDRFDEDPVRILRIARFASRYAKFKIAPSTFLLIRNMVHDCMAHNLSSDRVRVELYKVLSSSKFPDIFFKTLDDFGCHDIIFPELKLDVNRISEINFGPLSIRQRVAILFSKSNYDKNEIINSRHFKKSDIEFANSYLMIESDIINLLDYDVKKSVEILMSIKSLNIDIVDEFILVHQALNFNNSTMGKYCEIRKFISLFVDSKVLFRDINWKNISDIKTHKIEIISDYIRNFNKK